MGHRIQPTGMRRSIYRILKPCIRSTSFTRTIFTYLIIFSTNQPVLKFIYYFLMFNSFPNCSYIRFSCFFFHLRIRTFLFIILHFLRRNPFIRKCTTFGETNFIAIINKIPTTIFIHSIFCHTSFQNYFSGLNNTWITIQTETSVYMYRTSLLPLTPLPPPLTRKACF